MSLTILLPATSAHRDCDGGATSTFVAELLDTVTNFLTHNLAARVVCGTDADDHDPVSCSRTNLLCPKATSQTGLLVTLFAPPICNKLNTTVLSKVPFLLANVLFRSTGCGNS